MRIKSNSLLVYLKDNFTEGELRTAFQVSVVEAFPGFAKPETISLVYTQFEDEIWELIKVSADLSGCKHMLAFVACLDGSESVIDAHQFKSLCVCHVVKEYARQIVKGGKLN